MLRRTLALLTIGLGVVLPVHGQSSGASGCEGVPPHLHCKLLADFESDSLGTPPRGWYTTRERELVPLTRSDAMGANRNVYVRQEQGNRFARIYTKDYGFRVVLPHERGLDWHLGKRPYLRWRWRATALPEGANESRSGRNDTGGALYVTFDTDWLGRPKSIKYTYSSALPVGATVDFGPLKVLVVASEPDTGLGRWITHERNVVEDYRRLFGEAPDKTPLAVMMWSDSDSVHSVGTIDFDDLVFLAKPSRADSTTASSR